MNPEDTIQPVTPELIAAAASRIGLAPDFDHDGDLPFAIRAGNGYLGYIGFIICRPGHKKVTISGYSDVVYDVEHLGQLQAATAAFHREYSWPTAYPIVIDGEDGARVQLRGHFSIPTTAGLSTNQLASYIHTAVLTLQQMVTTVDAAIMRSTPVTDALSAAELESWLQD